MNLYRNTKAQAFTIVELLIVVVVIAILAAITIVSYNGITSQARASALVSSLNQAAKKVALHYVVNSSYPDSLSSVSTEDSGGIAYQYDTNSTGYCITVNQGDSTAQIGGVGGSVNSPVFGAPCPGHTGNITVTAESLDCPAGFIAVPGNSLIDQQSFCTMKYEAKNDGSDTPVSIASGSPWVNINQTDAKARSAEACNGCHLITESEWMTMAANVLSVSSNWSGGTVGSGYIYNGHVNNNPASALVASADDSNGTFGITGGTGNTPSDNNRRTLTLTNGEVVWDLAGNIIEWTDATIGDGKPGNTTDWSWHEYTNISSAKWSGFPLTSHPAIAGASSFNAHNGIGRIYTNTSDTATRGFIRGGSWNTTSYGGVFYLNLNDEPSHSGVGIGFRVSK